MVLQIMALDPNAISYTDDQIVGKVNTATAQITRASSVASAARPIENLEVTAAKIAANAVDNTKLAAQAAKANLDAIADTARGYVKTDPAIGEFTIVAVQRDAAGKLGVKYDDVARII